MKPTTRAERLHASWFAEIESYLPEDTDYDVVDCAIPPDELIPFEYMADEHEAFWHEVGEWQVFIWDEQIWLPLEQSCYDGLLLPVETRMMRLITCPEPLLRSLRWFFEVCPEHVKQHLAYWNYLVVRVERGRRTGKAEWRPADHVETEGPALMFKWGSRFHPRNYAR